MAFEVVAAIDLSRGALARATSSGVERVETFGGDPLAAAASAIEEGVRWIHVVDLDRAMTGASRNLKIMRSIADLGVLVQASGGIIDADTVDESLSTGAARVVLSSATLLDLERARELIRVFGERLAIGIEARGDRIRARGGIETDLPFGEPVDDLAAAGAARFVVTAVPRVGSLSGPNMEQVARAVETGRPVLAAGGIASLGDLRLLRDAGAAGAIVGRAALEGTFDLRGAIAEFGGERDLGGGR